MSNNNRCVITLTLKTENESQSIILGCGYRSGYRTNKPLISVAPTGNKLVPSLALDLAIVSHYLTVDDLTEYERPVTGPLDTLIILYAC